MIPISDLIERIILSAVLGAIIGIERQLRNRHTGLRTMALLCMSSCCFSFFAVSIYEIYKIEQIGNTIVGTLLCLGFIGNGVIYKEKENGILVVRGLTTAVLLIVISIIGILIGAGFIREGLIVWAITIIIVFGGRIIEKKLGLRKGG